MVWGTSLFLTKYDDTLRDFGIKMLPYRHSDGTFSTCSKFCESGDGIKLLTRTVPQDFEGGELCEAYEVRITPLLTAT